MNPSSQLAVLASIGYLLAAGFAVASLYYNSLRGVVVFGVAMVVMGYAILGLVEMENE